MLPENLERKIDRSGECHLWVGAVDPDGYGRACHRRRMWLAHRLIYTLEVGPIPRGMTIDHVRSRGCASRACVRLDHLEVASRRENVLRGDTLAAVNAAKTHCPNGHVYDGLDSRGWRVCKRCRAATIARCKARSRRGGG